MTTQEEIEAAVERCNRAIVNVSWDTSGVGEYRSGKHNWISDCAIITRAYLAERQQRERDQQPPTREMYERFGNWAWFCWCCGAERVKLDNAHIVAGQGREHDRRCIVRLCRKCHKDQHNNLLSTANLCWLKHNFDLPFYDVDYLAQLLIRRATASQRHPLPAKYREAFLLNRGTDHVKAGASLRREWEDTQ